MAITRQKKEEILQELIDKFQKSKTVIFSDYRGLDVSAASDLRKKLRESGSEAKVAKKTLIRLAAKQQGINDIPEDILAGPVSATFSYEDELSGLKVLFDFSKGNENLKLLGGIIDGKLVGAGEVLALAKLPGREELLAKLIGSMNAPVSGFVGIMSNLLSGFVRVVNAYKDTLPAEAAPEAPAAEPVKEVETEPEATEEPEAAPAETPETPETPTDEVSATNDNEEEKAA